MYRPNRKCGIGSSPTKFRDRVPSRIQLTGTRSRPASSAGVRSSHAVDVIGLLLSKCSPRIFAPSDSVAYGVGRFAEPPLLENRAPLIVYLGYANRC